MTTPNLIQLQSDIEKHLDAIEKMFKHGWGKIIWLFAVFSLMMATWF